MNAKIYCALFVSLITLSIGAMENRKLSGVKRTYASEASGRKNTKKLISIAVSMPRNAVGSPAKEKLDLSNEDPILQDSFEELIAAKHAKNDSYLLARTAAQVEDGTLVHYFDAHAFNRIFGQYPFQNLKELWKYNHPIIRKPIQLLDYYECEPKTKVFKFVCTYAALRSENEQKRGFYQDRFHANQEEDLKLTAEAKHDLGYMYHHGEGVEVDYAKAKKLYEQAANQKDDLGAAASAKNNLGFMYQNGLIKPIDYAMAKQLFEQGANQTDDLGAAAASKNNLGHMYHYGEGVAVDYGKAKELYGQAANQTDDVGVAASAQCNLGVMYKKGHGMAVDYGEAKKLYGQAAEQTHDLRVAAKAKIYLAELEALMKDGEQV